MNCPKCLAAPELVALRLGDTELERCEGCEGLWVSRESLEVLRDSHARRAELLAAAPEQPRPREDSLFPPCPCCREPMERLEFAKVSGVIVDRCRAHGIWFDADELRQVVLFLEAGGDAKAREAEEEDLAAQLAARRAPFGPGFLKRQLLDFLFELFFC